MWLIKPMIITSCDATCHHRSWSTLVQAMSCYLTAPSHYLNQCPFAINWVVWPISQEVLKWSIHEIKWVLKITFVKLLPQLSWANVVTADFHFKATFCGEFIVDFVFTHPTMSSKMVEAIFWRAFMALVESGQQSLQLTCPRYQVIQGVYLP